MTRIEAAKGLLKRIEEVDHEDSVDMDELNARWWCLRVDEQFISCKRSIENSGLGDCICIKFYHPESGHGNGFVTLRDFYTRSRDALKAARPEGWKFSIKYDWAIERYVSSGCSDYKKPNNINTQYAKVCSPYLENMTECLAEFHAIVQAWIYVWENGA